MWNLCSLKKISALFKRRKQINVTISTKEVAKAVSQAIHDIVQADEGSS